MWVSAGLKLAQCDFVAVNNGITVTKSCLQLNVINNHINARTACINGAEINQSCIMGNLFYKDPSSQGATVGVQIHGNSAWNVIANNVSLQSWLLMCDLRLLGMPHWLLDSASPRRRPVA